MRLHAPQPNPHMHASSFSATTKPNLYLALPLHMKDPTKPRFLKENSTAPPKVKVTKLYMGPTPHPLQ